MSLIDIVTLAICEAEIGKHCTPQEARTCSQCRPMGKAAVAAVGRWISRMNDGQAPEVALAKFMDETGLHK